MGPGEIARRRMFAQRLWGAPFDDASAALRAVGAVQSQEFAVAKWSLGQRSKGSDEGRVDRLYAEGAILRTHALRPTWHFVLPEDIGWLQALTGPRVNARNGPIYRRLELDVETFATSQSAIAGALEGGPHLTRTELAAVLERAGITASGSRLAHIVMQAELDGLICSGAPNGRQHTYALLDERSPNALRLDRTEALAEMTRRFFTTRGPATAKDFVWWSSLPLADVRSGLEMVRSDLACEVVDGRTYWFAPIPLPRKRKSPSIDLVQGFDEVMVPYSESRDVLFEWFRPSPSLGRPLYLHAVLLDGRLIGHWKPIRDRAGSRVEAWCYRKLDTAEGKSLEAAVERYAGFLGEQVTLINVKPSLARLDSNQD